MKMDTGSKSLLGGSGDSGSLLSGTSGGSILGGGSSGTGRSASGKVQVRQRGDRFSELDMDEIRGKLRGSGANAREVNRVVTKVEDWAKIASAKEAIDYRDLDKKVSDNLSNENPGAAAKYDAKFTGN